VPIACQENRRVNRSHTIFIITFEIKIENASEWYKSTYGITLVFNVFEETPMPKLFDLKMSIILLMLGGHATSATAASRCEDFFADKGVKASRTLPPVTSKSPQVSWSESVDALKQIDQSVYGRSQVIETLTTAILAKEFVWINGEPGGAKTFLSRLMFQSVLNSIPEKDKKIFVLQFHKLISEGKISGFQKFSSMMKDGKYEIETSTSLVGDKFLFLIADEAEKSNPAVLNALLSVLNERKAFLGSKVVDSILSSGVFTSNKTTGEFIQGFYSDRPSGEALLDRMAIKIHIPNQQLSAKETIAMYDLVKNPQKLKINLPLGELQSLVNKVKIPDDMMAEIVEIARTFDRYVTDKADKSREQVRYGEADSEYFPANQFSNRSVRRMVQVFKASLVAHQLMQGVAFDQVRLTPKKEDLALLAKSALYVGPSQVKLKSFKMTEMKDGKITTGGVRVVSDLGVKSDLLAEYSPYDGKLFLQDLEGQTQIILKLENNKWIISSKSSEFQDYVVDENSLNSINGKLAELLAANKVDLGRPQFEVDSSSVDKLLAKGTVKGRTQKELESIKQDLAQFAETLNQQFDKDSTAKALAVQKLLPPRSTKEIRAFRREMMTAPEKERVGRYYDWMTYEVKALKQRFVELEYSIEAHLTGILSENHLYVFGPPGGAKTALAEVILKSELKKLNADQIDFFTKKVLTNKKADQKFIQAVLQRMRQEKPKVFERFLLQFHKLLPEGVLVGFPKIEKQLNEGKEEIETSTSLASEKFIFAILDEVDKANPQTITALLSILNEREVFAGNQVIKTALRTAVLTSNKMPSEFLDSYHEDRSTGEAVMDRAPNKVFVSNKISSEEALTQFLSNLEKGISPNWKGLLAVGELKPLVDQVEFESPAVKEALAKIHEKFLALRIKKEEETLKDHKMYPRDNPDYYVAASGSASDRTVIKLIDQFKARFIVHQLMQGVAFKDIKTTIEMKDLNLFFEGLGYWAPQKIVSSYNQDGTLEFKNDSQVIERLLGSGVLDSRVRFHLKMMIEEARDYAQVANSVVQDFVTEYKSEITKYPDLFPSMVGAKVAGKLPANIQKAVNSSIENLSKFRLKLETEKAQGASSLQLTALKQDYIKKETELVKYLEDYKIMTREQLKEKMKEIILKTQDETKDVSRQEEKKKEEQKKVVKEVLDPADLAKKMIFHEIKPGKFNMGEIGSQVETEITIPFEMMETQVTQMMWARLKIAMGEKDLNKINPSNFKTGTDSTTVNIEGIDVQMKADHPVEQVSWTDVKEFIDGLNKLSSTGDTKTQGLLEKLIPGHKKGDIYDFPSEAQWEFVMRDRGNANKKHFDRDDDADLPKHAWFSVNSGDETHAVATLQPRMIDGKPFYDLEGNVGEWNKDSWDRSTPLPGGKDPLGTAGSRRVVRGGTLGSNAQGLRSGGRGDGLPGSRFEGVGCRLVRTRP
jgi:formylglycine-generating enzyme required for sulfatase activity/MoxR-like ATPase